MRANSPSASSRSRSTRSSPAHARGAITSAISAYARSVNARIAARSSSRASRTIVATGGESDMRTVRDVTRSTKPGRVAHVGPVCTAALPLQSLVPVPGSRFPSPCPSESPRRWPLLLPGQHYRVPELPLAVEAVGLRRGGHADEHREQLALRRGEHVDRNLRLLPEHLPVGLGRRLHAV